MNVKLWWLIHRETRKNSYYLSPSRHGGVFFDYCKGIKGLA